MGKEGITPRCSLGIGTVGLAMGALAGTVDPGHFSQPGASLTGGDLPLPESCFLLRPGGRSWRKGSLPPTFVISVT